MKLFNKIISIEMLWCIAVLSGVFIFMNTHPIRPQDFWWHIAIGRDITLEKIIPEVDIYSSIMYGQPYPSYKMYWLMEVLLYTIYRIGGPSLIIFVQGLIITSTYAMLMWLCKIISGNWRIAAFSTVYAVSMGLNDWNARPQSITFLLGIFVLFAINKLRTGKNIRWVIIFPISMFVWVNSHGSFIIGIILIILWLLDEIQVYIFNPNIRQEGSFIHHLQIPLLSLFFSGLACLFNPRGLGIINYLQTMTGSTVIQKLVLEWSSPDFNTLHGIIFFVGLLVLSVVLAISPRRPNFYQIITFIVFALLGFKTSRGIIWFGLLTAPIIADHITAINQIIRRNYAPRVKQKEIKLINNLFLLLFILMIIISLPWFKEYLPFPAVKAGIISSETPLGGADFLLNNQYPKKLFNTASFGSYLIWAFNGKEKVFIDTRIELYPPEIWNDYLLISMGVDGWEEMLAQYEIQTLMLSRDEQPLLIERVDNSPIWERVYQDSVSSIYYKKP